MARGLTVAQLREVMKGLEGDTVVIIGDDDELNGVHNAWYAQVEELKNVKLSRHGQYHGEIMECEEFPGSAFEVYLCNKNEKINKIKVLLIT